VTPLHALQQANGLLVLPNAWDVLSARLSVQAGARAVATSSAALAWSLGFPDGEHLPLPDLTRAVTAIARAVSVPVSVDLERGYGATPSAVADSVSAMIGAGACGVNLEDAAQPAERLAETIAVVRSRVGASVFINARTDVVLRATVPKTRVAEEVLARAAIFERAGADGIFVPYLSDGAQIEAIARGTKLPLNVMLCPGCPLPTELVALGARRLSAGIGIARAAYAHARTGMRNMLAGSYEGLLDGDLTYQQLNGLFSASD